MSNVKLSQIAAGNPVNFNTDFLVGVQASNTTDARLTPAQLFTSFPLVNTSTAGVVPTSPGGASTFLRADGTWATPGLGSGLVSSISFIIDNGGNTLTTGVKGYQRIDFNCTIVEVALLADVTGNCTLDLWKCTYAQYDGGVTHPVVGDSITASANPILTSAVKYDDSTLTGWNTTVNAGDIIAYDVKVAASAATRVTVDLKVVRT